MRLRNKIVLYIVAWLLALYAANPSLGYWSLAWMFPLGLAGFIKRELGNDGGWGVFGACYAVYLAHAWFYFRSRTPRLMWILFAVLVILLLCNVRGCHVMNSTH